MSKPIEEDLSTLSSAEHGLAYLTPNDWALIVDKAIRVRFGKGQSIIQMGKRPNGVYLLLKGTANVQIPSQNTFRDLGLRGCAGKRQRCRCRARRGLSGRSAHS